ncbi:hypothetical protein DO021_15420 [Desulfobacter hydrogenophilus]|uniref:Uncharacterized protein n=1 Tax=Desulfobacter hydrogenophilus TaxID=2291 RepID=A0A328FDH2_9BACT|nr:hypothetical protein [Desulfobacter hydrogenophilus]NDY73071.1 hypothetical protein [Desulfobacter hydrogenophilus]QBH13579.1 hypothetical protein EYB58_11965 [Desulfobacter hydrogenophilus]RAM01077.1 hypothetical protein DO021_15420 [Desulfobacter hydrogenophilus]
MESRNREAGMLKIEKNLREDGFKFLENHLAEGVTTVEKGEFQAHFIHAKDRGTMPAFETLNDGTLHHTGPMRVSTWRTFLDAIVTCEFDFVEYAKR